MRSYYQETGEEKGKRLNRIRFDILSAYSSIKDICLAGFVAGQLMFLTGMLFLLGAFIIPSIFEVGMGATGFLQNVLKASPSSEGGGSLSNLLRLILGLWPFSLGLGGMGILSAVLLHLSRKRFRPQDFFQDTRRIPGDLIAFCALFLALSIIKTNLAIIFAFLTLILHQLWRYWYKISLRRISKFDAYRVMAEHE